MDKLAKLKAAIDKVRWPQVGLLAVVVAAVLYAAERLPQERWEGLVSLGLAVLGALGLAVSRSVLGRDGGDA
ncbi:MAG TPA: hypothetical protein VM513_09015 [Kofleriaceae bacterium]|jgi:hypothetical protein|nr:hypothetical protein [Kofleriaceae bacterium]